MKGYNLSISTKLWLLLNLFSVQSFIVIQKDNKPTICSQRKSYSFNKRYNNKSNIPSPSMSILSLSDNNENIQEHQQKRGNNTRQKKSKRRFLQNAYNDKSNTVISTTTTNSDGANDKQTSSSSSSNYESILKRQQQQQKQKHQKSSNKVKSINSHDNVSTTTNNNRQQQYDQQINNPKKLKRSTKINKNDYKKSIDELESLMNKKFSSSSSTTFSASSASSSNSNNLFVDSKKKKHNNKQQKKQEFEYYDEDDEGYEIENGDDDDDVIIVNDDDYDDYDDSSIVSSTTNIKSKSFTINDDDDDDDKNEGSIFGFSRTQQYEQEDDNTNNKKIVTIDPQQGSSRSSKSKEVTSISKKQKKKQEDKKNNEEEIVKPKNKRDVLQPILDSNGKPKLLTLDTIKIPTTSSLQTNEDNPQEDNDNDNNFPKTFEEMSIHPKIINNLKNKLKCTTPLYVQQRSYNAIYNNNNNDNDDDNDNTKPNNIILATSTGSGKTLAFLLPIIQRCIDNNASALSNNNNSNKIHTMIIVPGRELASQIYNVAQNLLDNTAKDNDDDDEDLGNLKVGLCIGGTSYQRNIEMIRKKRPNIIIGTPGRIHELLFGNKVSAQTKTPKIKLNPKVDDGLTYTLVLDEFDDLFSNNKYDQQSSFDSYTKQSTKEIYNYFQRRLPHEKSQFVFCSATALFQSKGYINQFITNNNNDSNSNDSNNSNWITIKQKTSSNNEISLSPTTKHGIIQTSRMKRIDTIRRIVNTEPNPQQIIIFVNHVSTIDTIVNALKSYNIIAVPLHAGTTSTSIKILNSSTASQERALITKELRDGYIGIVVTTELLARGLDAPYVTHVINYDIPTNSIHYVHRIGRVGRNGKKGIVLNLVENNFEEGIYKRFGKELGLVLDDDDDDDDDSSMMCICEPRGGKLTIMKKSVLPN